MGASATSSGNQVKLSDLDALYQRLYTLKTTHINSTAQINKSALTTPAVRSGLSQGSIVKPTSITTLKNELANLAKSQWYQSNTRDTVVTMTDYSTSVTTPTVGALLKSSDFNLIESAITSAEAIVPNYANKYNARYGTCYSGCYGQRYVQRYNSCYGCYSGRYSGQYGCYSGRYGSRYGTCYSCYSYRYSSRYGSCYGSRYIGKAVQIRC